MTDFSGNVDPAPKGERNFKRFGFFLLMVGLLALSLSVQAKIIPFDFSDPVEEQRYNALIAELRCLVCQNQSLADSNADLAQDLRNEIYAMMKKGASNKEIIDFLTARYGDFVLYRPPLKPITVLLWFAPLILFVIALVVLIKSISRRGQAPEPALSKAEQQRLKRLLKNPDKEKDT